MPIRANANTVSGAQVSALIQNADVPLKAVAPAVGIGDVYQLSRLFRQQYHVSPSQLRRRHLSQRVHCVARFPVQNVTELALGF